MICNLDISARCLFAFTFWHSTGDAKIPSCSIGIFERKSNILIAFAISMVFFITFHLPPFPVLLPVWASVFACILKWDNAFYCLSLLLSVLIFQHSLLRMSTVQCFLSCFIFNLLDVPWLLMHFPVSFLMHIKIMPFCSSLFVILFDQLLSHNPLLGLHFVLDIGTTDWVQWYRARLTNNPLLHDNLGYRVFS